MQNIQFLGKKVAYYQTGSGQPLVLLHGLCEDSTIWDEFIGDLSMYQIIRVDLSGFGGSEILPEHSIALMAQSVKVVLDSLSIDQCVVVGHSMGGYVALSFARQYPDVIKGLGLFHSHPFTDSDLKKAERTKAIEFIKKNGHILYVKQMIPKLFAELFATSNEFLINALILKASKYPAEAIIGAHEAMLNRDDSEILVREMKCPVLMIIGKQDTTVPYQTSVKSMSLPPIADIHILPKVAHMGMYRAKTETVKIVDNFMQFCE
jgi:pimeloyl-ACP methyl ester carboxylesterase